MTALFNRWLPALTLGIWSLVLLYFAKAYGPLLQWVASWSGLLTGRVESLLAPPFRPFMLAAGFVLLLLSLIFLLFPADTACCSAAECGHPLSRFAAGRWLTFLILVVPVAVAARYSPQGFSRNAMENRGIITDASQLRPQPSRPNSTAEPLNLPLPQADTPPAIAPISPISPTAAAPATTSAPAAATPSPTATATAPAQPASLESYVQKTPEGYLEAEVLDLLYAAQDNTLRKVFEGKTVQLIGQLMPDPADAAEGKTHRFKTVRMFMTCCAADARPVATSVEAAELPKHPEMTWVKVIGTATFPIEKGRRAAVLKADSVEKTEPPAESMLY